MRELVRDLFPICRSITGNGVRQTLARLSRNLPLRITEVPSGTPVLDWHIPREWNIRDAWIKNVAGERVVDFRAHNLHVVSYSTPVRGRMTLQELRRHLHSLPDHPDWIPYRTSYYAEDWGFCLTHRQYEALNDPQYDVCIDADLSDGSLTYGECVLAGQSKSEVLISTHVCHPSMANDNLSGIAVAAALAQRLSSAPRFYSYRFVFVPGTIGAIAWLAGHEAEVSRIKHGIVLAGVGGPHGLTYKQSRRGDAVVDRAAAHVLRYAGGAHEVEPFSPYGHDERQYCSPGFNLPVGCLMRSVWGTYAEYHSSADSIEFVTNEALESSLEACLQIVDVLEGDRTYINGAPKGEPQLGRRGLYRTIGGGSDRHETEMAMLWVLNLSDGSHSLLDIAERAMLPFAAVRRAADALIHASLLSEVNA
jgi:aminopeptidase-like protein